MPVVHVERYEDMSPLGRLRVYKQEDGDMILAIVPDPDAQRSYSPSVEFCTRAGGGQSQHVREALKNLFEAIEKDNAERPQNRSE